ncbi:hypothetical protein FISHEDRAFT_7584, partial [Fistulina hepatica ATCC 64428]
MTPEEHHEAVFLLGPWLVGCYIEIFLQGILCCQFTTYLSWYRDDKPWLRYAVYMLILITTLKSIQSFALIWIMLIENFTDLSAAINLNYTTWWQSGSPLMVACIGFYVQMYFLYRLWMISRKWWVVGPILIVFVFAFVSIVIGTYYITTAYTAGISHWFAAHLSSVFAGDLSLTCTTAYFLIKSKKNVHPQTVGLINALVRLTFSTVLPGAICAMLNLIFSQIYLGTNKLISEAFNQALPKLYAISMMWTLNARRSIRATHGSSNNTGSTSADHSGPRSRGTRRTAM